MQPGDLAIGDPAIGLYGGHMIHLMLRPRSGVRNRSSEPARELQDSMMAELRESNKDNSATGETAPTEYALKRNLNGGRTVPAR